MERTNKNEKHKRAFIIGLTICLLITLFSFLWGNYLLPLPSALRTLILTVIVVTVMYYFLVPLFNKLLNSWLRQ